MTDWVAVGVGMAGIAVSSAGWFMVMGRSHQKIDDLKERVDGHDAEIIAMRTVMAALQASADRVVSAIEAQKQIWAGEIGRLSDKVTAGQDLLNTKLDAGDRLAARELEQLKHDVRGLTQQIDRLPHPRRRSTAD